MSVTLLIIAIICLIVGILGSFLPVLPGPPISWLALLLVNFTDYGHFSNSFLIITAAITLFLTLLDYILPSIAVRKKGGTKAGEKGATAGALLGMFFGPLGIIIGPFIGALAGEIIANPANTDQAFRIALSSFTGFLLSTGIKFIWCLMLAFWFIREVAF